MLTAFVTVPNIEDPEVGGFFAYTDEDYEQVRRGVRCMFTRGYGDTPLQAIACLCALLDEEQGHTWGQQPTLFI